MWMCWCDGYKRTRRVVKKAHRKHSRKQSGETVICKVKKQVEQVGLFCYRRAFTRKMCELGESSLMKCD